MGVPRVFLIEPHTPLPSHVSSSLKRMIKNVQVTGDSIDEDDLDEAVKLHSMIIPGCTHSFFQGCKGPRTARKGIRRGSEGGTHLDRVEPCNTH